MCEAWGEVVEGKKREVIGVSARVVGLHGSSWQLFRRWQS